MSKIDPLEKIEFQIGKFAIDFLWAYLEFLGAKSTVEDVCRELVFDGIVDLRDHLSALPYYEDGFFEKYPHLSMMDSRKQKLAEDEPDC